MSDKNDGGQAFPKLERSYEDRSTDNTIIVSSDGMTLRDYFAAKALFVRSYSVRPYDNTAEVAADCYKMADAMLKAREL